MTTFKNLQDEVIQTLYGFGLDQPRYTQLSGAIAAGDTSFGVVDASSMDQGLIEVDGELMYVASVNRTTNVLTIAGDGRGFFGTTAVSHLTGTRVTMSPVWPRNRVKSAINDAIQGTHPNLFGIGTTSFTFQPVQHTYPLPANTTRILRCEVQTYGPTLEPQQVNRYVYNGVAPVAQWPTGKTITFQEMASPGRTATVTTMLAPQALVNDSDDFTGVSGLQPTARPCIIYGAAYRLTSTMDVARLEADTARAAELATKTPVGTASRITAQLEQLYMQELEEERKRLREQTPTVVRYRKR